MAPWNWNLNKMLNRLHVPSEDKILSTVLFPKNIFQFDKHIPNFQETRNHNKYTWQAWKFEQPMIWITKYHPVYRLISTNWTQSRVCVRGVQTQKQKKLKQSLLPWNAALPSLPSMPSRQQVKETSCGRQAAPNSHIWSGSPSWPRTLARKCWAAIGWWWYKSSTIIHAQLV